MKLKLAIIYGMLIWLLTHAFHGILDPIFNDNLPYFDMVFTIIFIIGTGFFAILYIRNINKNELDEGFLVGVIFCVVYLIMDFVYLTLFSKIFFIPDYLSNTVSIIVMTLIITTFLGYLAQMEINLK